MMRIMKRLTLNGISFFSIPVYFDDVCARFRFSSRFRLAWISNCYNCIGRIIAGYLIEGDSGAYFIQDGPVEWLTAGVINFRGIYWEVERDTLIAIPLCSYSWE